MASQGSSSAGSVLSIGSSGSILSIGSVGSVLSIGSAGSILSIGSFGSVLSIGSACSIGSILSACGIGTILSAPGRERLRPDGTPIVDSPVTATVSAVTSTGEEIAAKLAEDGYVIVTGMMSDDDVA